MFVALQLIATARRNIEETTKIVDEEALQVGDRNVLAQSIATIASELDVLARTFRDMLDDPTKSE